MSETIDRVPVGGPETARAADAGGASDLRMRLADVIGALSYALDLTEGQPQGHSLRCAWIGMHVGIQLGMPPEALSDLYYTLLLKDAGCSSNAARLWALYGGDERQIKHDFKTVDAHSLLKLGQFVLRHTGPGEPLRRRAQRLFTLARHGDEFADELVQTRCERGAGHRAADRLRDLGRGWCLFAGRALERQGPSDRAAWRGDSVERAYRFAGADRGRVSCRWRPGRRADY